MLMERQLPTEEDKVAAKVGRKQNRGGEEARMGRRKNGGEKDMGRGGSGSDGLYWILSPPPFSQQTCTSYITGTGPRRPIAWQEVYRGEREFVRPPALSSCFALTFRGSLSWLKGADFCSTFPTRSLSHAALPLLLRQTSHSIPAQQNMIDTLSLP